MSSTSATSRAWKSATWASVRLPLWRLMIRLRGFSSAPVDLEVHGADPKMLLLDAGHHFRVDHLDQPMLFQQVDVVVEPPRCQPLMTATGRSRATFAAMPAAETTSTTASTSL